MPFESAEPPAAGGTAGAGWPPSLDAPGSAAGVGSAVEGAAVSEQAGGEAAGGDDGAAQAEASSSDDDAIDAEFEVKSDS